MKAADKPAIYVKMGLVELLPSGDFLISPIPQVTQQYHKVFRLDAGLKCDCQGFGYNGGCSHVEAVGLWLSSRKVGSAQIAVIV